MSGQRLSTYAEVSTVSQADENQSRIERATPAQIADMTPEERHAYIEEIARECAVWSAELNRRLA